jgi:hypothetical protein
MKGNSIAAHNPSGVHGSSSLPVQPQPPPSKLPARVHPLAATASTAPPPPPQQQQQQLQQAAMNSGSATESMPLAPSLLLPLDVGALAAASVSLQSALVHEDLTVHAAALQRAHANFEADSEALTQRVEKSVQQLDESSKRSALLGAVRDRFGQLNAQAQRLHAATQIRATELTEAHAADKTRKIEQKREEDEMERAAQAVSKAETDLHAAQAKRAEVEKARATEQDKLDKVGITSCLDRASTYALAAAIFRKLTVLCLR